MYEIKKHAHKIRQAKPLILNLTNYVTMDFVANGLLSIGASPVMIHAEEEVMEMMHLASAVVINIGTLDPKFIQLCYKACEAANQLQKPIIFDPVGAGASLYRTSTCHKILSDYQIAILRGNASEVMAIANASVMTKGVDSTMDTQAAIESGQRLSDNFDTAVVISGETDVIIDNNLIQSFKCGSALMPMITGSGCLLSSIVAAFYAIEPNRFQSASAATLYYGTCGEIAAEKSFGPGTFK